MNVLAACEESQRVTYEFRKFGHNAYSCDIEPESGGFPEWHIQGDVLPLLNGDCSFLTNDGKEHRIEGPWDIIIAFPPCTHLAASGARWYREKVEDGRQKEAIKFFLEFTKTNCLHVAIENPVGIMSSHYRKPDQFIQPYEYGDGVRKKTCLWLKNLPELKPTKIVDVKLYRSGGKTYSGPAYYARDENGKILGWGDPQTKKIRSKTYKGIAEAMAAQWGGTELDNYQIALW